MVPQKIATVLISNGLDKSTNINIALGLAKLIAKASNVNIVKKQTAQNAQHIAPQIYNPLLLYI